MSERVYGVGDDERMVIPQHVTLVGEGCIRVIIRDLDVAFTQ